MFDTFNYLSPGFLLSNIAVYILIGISTRYISYTLFLYLQNMFTGDALTSSRIENPAFSATTVAVSFHYLDLASKSE